MTDSARLIEVAFPLRQTSLDSVHEKNVRHGHISTLHIWPARRPLAACRAALVATLLPDPGTPEERALLLEKLGGHLKETRKRKKSASGHIEEQVTEETEGGILHWGRENGPDLAWFRERIRAAYGGRAPKVLDPFAGGGAIPLEAMRLGCEVTASDLNPVAWFILKCTLEYPQRLAGQRRSLPRFAQESPEFMATYARTLGNGQTSGKHRGGVSLPLEMAEVEADLAGHVRAWGWWVLQRAKADLERFYPTMDGQPTVAYLWARTVRCKSCGAIIPLLKTRWLCKKGPEDTPKRVLLTMEPNQDRTGVVFGVQTEAPVGTGTAVRRPEPGALRAQQLGVGTMSRSGGKCPCCPALMTMEDIRLEGQAGRLDAVMTAVVVDGLHGKEYRRPTDEEVWLASEAAVSLESTYAGIPFGLPQEPTPERGSGASRAFSVRGYGMDDWSELFTARQLLALGVFVQNMRAGREAMAAEGYGPDWVEAISCYLASSLDRLANQSSAVSRWNQGGENVEGTFARFALPILWDFAELNPLGQTTGGYPSALEWVSLAVDHLCSAEATAPGALVRQATATEPPQNGNLDIVVTDPPYYDAIPYSDLMDFFYVWLRRTLHGLSPEFDDAFQAPLAPKWDTAKNDGELIDDASRFGGNRAKSKQSYEDGMFRAFQACNRALRPDGRLVIVFANKQPDAWETLVSAIIRAGFVVDGSWPIETERAARARSLSSAALASSVWLVCKKRSLTARPGWDNGVLADMRANIATKLRDFWDAGIRGPDFVWAATGPALEAYSKYPVVRKATEAGKVMDVGEFLRHVRRIVVDYIVGQVLSGDGAAEVAGELDDLTTYYLLHRHDFGLADAPIGAVILYSISCNLKDVDLVDRYDLLARSGRGGSASGEDEDDVVDEVEVESGGGSKVRLKPWTARARAGMGYDAANGRPAPLIDQIHRLLHLWRGGDVTRVDNYLEERGLRRQPLFGQVLQALIELAGEAPRGHPEERALLESLSNHVGASPARASQPRLVEA